MRKKPKKKSILILILCLLLVLMIGISIVYISCNGKKKKEIVNYSENVVTVEEIKLYSLANSNYIESGLIGKNVELLLDNIDNEYFKIKNFDNYYIKYNNVQGIEDYTES